MHSINVITNYDIVVIDNVRSIEMISSIILLHKCDQIMT